MKKTLFVLFVLLGLSALISIFCYAVFGTIWWEPIKSDNEASRGMALFMLHGCALALGIAGLMNLTDPSFTN